MDPAGVGDASRRCQPRSLYQHFGVRVEADDSLKEGGGAQRYRARAASDIKQPARAVQAQ